MIELRPEDLRKNHIEILHKYIALFEEYLQNQPSYLEHDNFDDYREAVRKYNEISPKKYDATGTLIELENIENKNDEPLPWEVKWD